MNVLEAAAAVFLRIFPLPVFSKSPEAPQRRPETQREDFEGRTARLEHLIERAGRQDVFYTMRAAGWGSMDRPPVWVWEEAAILVLSRKHQKSGGLGVPGFVPTPSARVQIGIAENLDTAPPQAPKTPTK
jgi:hypothetical protein